ncbi:MAG TPA: hypothetical protein VNH21_13335 [Steroidobacteraceae bacterium]|nr:hypothetical protein [Steroidobacteraceae bacterium]
MAHILTNALCYCGRPLGHSGMHIGSEAAKRGGVKPGPQGPRGFQTQIERERHVLAGKRDRTRHAIQARQAELAAIEAKLEALNALEAAYRPDAKPTNGAAPQLAPPPLLGRPFRIGERN